MKKKTWSLTIVDNPNKVTSSANANDTFYVTDTEAYLVINLLDEQEGFNPHSAELTLANMQNGSLAIYKNIPVVDKSIKWELIDDIITIDGTWDFQLIYENDEDGEMEYYTTPKLQFSINPHIKQGRKEAIIVIESLQDIIDSSSSLVDEWRTYFDNFIDRVDAGEFHGADGTVAFEELTEEQVESLRGDTGRGLQFNWDGTRLGIKAEGEHYYDYTDLKGDKGDSIQFNWDGVRLGVKTEDQINYEYTNLKGDKGDQGDSTEFVWDGTRLGIRIEGQSQYQYVNLKGDQGNSIEFNWNGTSLGLRIQGETEYEYINLKGDKGEPGNNLEFNWNGTSLGVRESGQTNYEYTDLKGAPGEIENLDESHVVNALGYTPANINHTPEYGGRFRWEYNPASDSLDLVVIENG